MKTQLPVCDRCGRVAHYRFSCTAATPAVRCWRHAVFYPPVFRRALQVAAVVGTILFLINQLNVVLMGEVTPLVIGKIVLTYLVPFLVATYSALEINRLKATVAASKAPPASPGAVA